MLSEFTWQGRTLQHVRAGALSTRTLLRERDSGKVLLSCRHETFKTVYFSGESDEELFRTPYATVFHSHMRILRGDHEIGRCFLVPRLPYLVPVVSGQGNELPLLQQIFVLISR